MKKNGCLRHFKYTENYKIHYNPCGVLLSIDVLIRTVTVCKSIQEKEYVKLRYCRPLCSLTTILFFKLYVTYGLLLN